MQKTAQKRSILNKLREMTNVSGIAAEKFFNPEFKRVMESLREKDDQIRSIVTGESIGNGDPGSDAVALKDLLKNVKSNLNRREFMSAIADLGRFHKKCFDLVQEIAKLSFDVDQVHHEFLFKDLDDEKKQHLQDMKSRFAAHQRDSIVKEASVMDFFYNIGTKRGRALAAWEKRYPKQVGKLKKDTTSLLARSEHLLAQILSSLKEMANARSIRNVDAYTKSADKITKFYNSYDALFRTFYNDNVKGFLEKVELASPVKPTDKVETKELNKQEIPGAEAPDTSKDNQPPSMDPMTVENPTKVKTQLLPPASQFGGPPGSSIPIPLVNRKGPTVVSPVNSTPAMPLGHTMPSPGVIPPPPRAPEITPGSGAPGASGVVPQPAPSVMFPASQPESAPTASELEDLGGGRAAEVLRQMQQPQPSQQEPPVKYRVDTGGATAHHKFYESLEKMGNESPLILAGFISKYARKIQAQDPQTAIELLKIVKNIRG